MSQLSCLIIVFVLSACKVGAQQEAKSGNDLEDHLPVGPGIAKFLTVLSGSYSNREEQLYSQATDGGIHHSLIEALVYPVDVPALYPALSVYFEEKADNVVLRAQILAVTEAAPKLFHLQPYDVSGSSVVTSEGIDLASISRINFADLTIRPECTVHYEEIEDAIYMANWPSCMTEGKTQVSYTITLTCKSLSFASFLNLYPEKSSQVPYIVKKIQSFPLLPYMYNGLDNVPNPCAS